MKYFLIIPCWSWNSLLSPVSCHIYHEYYSTIFYCQRPEEPPCIFPGPPKSEDEDQVDFIYIWLEWGKHYHTACNDETDEDTWILRQGSRNFFYFLQFICLANKLINKILSNFQYSFTIFLFKELAGMIISISILFAPLYFKGVLECKK